MSRELQRLSADIRDSAVRHYETERITLVRRRELDRETDEEIRAALAEHFEVRS